MSTVGPIVMRDGWLFTPAAEPARCLDCGVDISDLASQCDDIEWCEDCAGWPGRFTH